MNADRQSNPECHVTRFAQTAATGLRRSRPAVAAALFLLSSLSAGSAAGADDGDDKETWLVGVGLVIGLDGTGDSAIDPTFVDASIVGVLKRAGLEPWRGAIEPGRVAMVMLNAELPENAHDGMKIEVSVNAIGDARSLAGGTLLVVPLRDTEGRVHAIGKGSVAADLARLTDATVRQGRLAGGAVIERQDVGEDHRPLGLVAQNAF